MTPTHTREMLHGSPLSSASRGYLCQDACGTYAHCSLRLLGRHRHSEDVDFIGCHSGLSVPFQRPCPGPPVIDVRLALMPATSGEVRPGIWPTYLPSQQPANPL